MRKTLIALALLPTLALAEADPAIVDVLESCMLGPQDQTTARDCIGILTTQCVDGPDGHTTTGMVDCTTSETAAWDVLLNRTYQAARAAAQDLDARDNAAYAVRAETLLTAQRAWIAFRDANCHAEYAVWGAGSLRRVMGANCHLQMTAERAIALHNYAGGMQ